MAKRRRYEAVTVTLPDWQDAGSAMRWVGTEGAQAVQSSAEGYLALARSEAPKKTGDLARGIIVRPGFERTSGAKIVAEVCMDPDKNDRFVKISKAGKRYYYPASQEYGFRTRLSTGRYGSLAQVPGKYYMRTSAVEYSAKHEQNVSAALDKYLEEEAKL